ncbi:hypothetical protein [Pseudoroseicyclus tamaricis]|uniref:Type IV pilus biogenesis protein PilP n=1 Tax=Pseudoroseicyclus tamaricis TaxID=2705421 RepID=A0A6B2JV64_9RHOB|nr:hypothetical protein [Pseudoroseicyclus tamaricis]NDV01970.1 hypothetical protein [Pseudoroseicyclus tamaricis]
MKPAFALSLSVEGIRLLHRSGADWHLVGEVRLETGDLAADLATLRETALALEPKNLRTKLLIPNDQIRYIALDTTRASIEDIETALEGATPYAVSELSYDHTRGGGRTYIAAVARETLAEAEGFAVEHRFAPVCFAAAPEPFTFMGEPFFGATQAAATLLPPGEEPERDEAPVDPKALRTPRARLPWEKPGSRPGKAPLALMTEGDGTEVLEDAPEEEAPATRPAVLPVIEDDAPESGSEPLEDDAPAGVSEDAAVAVDDKPGAPVEPAADAPRAPEVSTPAAADASPEEPEPAAPAEPTEAPATDPVAEAPTETVAEKAPEAAALGFASRRRKPEPAPASTPEPAPAEPTLAEAPAPAPTADTPLFSSRARKWGSAPRDTAPKEPPPMSAASRPAERARAGLVPTPPETLSAGPRPMPQPKARPGSALAAKPSDGASATSPALTAEPARGPAALRTGAPPPPPPASRPTGGALRPLAPAGKGAMPPLVAAPTSARAPEGALGAAPAITGLSPEAKPPEEVTADVAPDIADSLTAETEPPMPERFTARTVTAPRSAPAFSPPAAAAPAPAAPGKEATPKPRPATAPPPEPGAAGPVPFETAEPAKAGVLSSLRSRRAAPEPQAKPDAEERARMTVFGARETAPRTTPRYLGLILTALLILAMLAVAAFAAPRVISALFSPSEDGAEAETEFAALPAPEAEDDNSLDGAIAATSALISGAESEPEEDDVASITLPEDDSSLLTPEEGSLAAAPLAPRGQVPSPAEAERFYAATGVWLRAPRLPLTPRTTSLEAMQVGLVEPAPESSAAPQIVRASPDPGLGPQIDPPPPGLTFERDARGFFLATEDGTVTPQGLVIYAGRPDIMPPTRPGTVAPEEPVFPVTYAPLSPPETRLRARPAAIEAAAAEATETEADAAAEEAGDTEGAEDPAADAPALASPEAADPESGAAASELSATDAAAIDAAATDPPVTAGAVGIGALGTVSAVEAGPGAPEATSDDAGQSASEILAPWSGPAPEDRPADLVEGEAMALLDPATTAGETAETTPTEVALSGDEPAPEILDSLPGPAPRNRPADLAPVSATADTAAQGDEPPPEILASWDGPTPALRPAALAPEPPAEILTAWDGPVPGIRPEDLAPATDEELAEEDDDEAGDEADPSGPPEGASLATALLEITSGSSDPLAGATPLAVATASRPDARPRNFDRVVAQQRSRQQTAPAPSAPAAAEPAAPAVVASSAVQPTGPVPGSVASAATIEDAINLRDINLIGVYGRPGDRRALVRLDNGRYVRVGVGDSLDGGQVTAIGDGALNYVKRGRTYALEVAEG